MADHDTHDHTGVPGVSGDLAGKELDYAQVTSTTNLTATTDATANTIVTGGSVAYDGATVVLIEFFAPYIECPATQNLFIVLYDGSSNIDRIGLFSSPDGGAVGRIPFYVAKRLTPSNASHTYSIRGYVGGGTGIAGAGAGGASAYAPSFIRITRVSS